MTSAKGARAPTFGSLAVRLYAASAIALAVFVGLVWVAQEQAFLLLVQGRLKGQMDQLIAATEINQDSDSNTPSVSVSLEPYRMIAQAEHLYAQISDVSGQPLWRSLTQADAQLRLPEGRTRGQETFAVLTDPDGKRYYTLATRLQWTIANTEATVDFQVAEGSALIDGSPYYPGEREVFRNEVWPWLLLSLCPLLILPLAIVPWTLAPIRNLARQIGLIERGEQKTVHALGLKELQPLVANLNALIHSSARNIERHQNAVADLAHSLKTPLSVIHGQLNRPEAPDSAAHSALERMRELIAYQLQRAEVRGPSALTPPVQVRAVVDKLRPVLIASFASKDFTFEVAIDTHVGFRGDPGDITELLGNLLENACKWCKERVRISAALSLSTQDNRHLLKLSIEDDGPGIPPELRQHVIQRGAKLDPSSSGQGIGLALAQELVVGDYGGTLTISSANQGGTVIDIKLPGALCEQPDAQLN